MGVHDTMSVAGPRDTDYARAERIRVDGARGDRGGRRIAIVAFVVVLLALASVGGASLYAIRGGGDIGGEPPLIRADAGATKQRPAEAGGLEVPHQDKLVFEQLAETPREPRLERLLPPPETPVPPAALPAPTTPAIAAPPDAPAAAVARIDPAPGDDTIAPSVTPPPAASPATSAVVAAPVQPRPDLSIGSVPIPSPPAAANSVPPPPPPQGAATAATAAPAAPAAAPPAAPAPAAPTEVAVIPAAGPAVAAAAAADGWRVQIGSFRDRAAGEGEWVRLQGRHPDLLGALAFRIQRADLSRGTFYRVQAGVLASRAAADALCGELKTRNQDCLVVSP